MMTTSDDQWGDLLERYQRIAFRLEQQPIYLSDVRSGALDQWLGGDETPAAPNDWSRMVAAQVADGKRMERIRIFQDPATPYQHWLRDTWSPKNVAAGEVQRYITRPKADQVGLTSAGDWWLLDDELLIWFHFDGVEPAGIEIIRDADRVAEAVRWWHVAVELAGKVVAPA